MPAQPFFCASRPRLPPTSAQRMLPPPSTTSTRPLPFVSNAERTNALSSNTFKVAAGPQNFFTLPKDMNTGGSTASMPAVNLSSCASQRSVVAKVMSAPDVVDLRILFYRPCATDDHASARRAVLLPTPIAVSSAIAWKPPISTNTHAGRCASISAPNNKGALASPMSKPE